MVTSHPKTPHRADAQQVFRQFVWNIAGSLAQPKKSRASRRRATGKRANAK